MSYCTISLAASVAGQSKWRYSLKHWGTLKNTNAQVWGHLPLVTIGSKQEVESVIKKLTVVSSSLPRVSHSFTFASTVSRDTKISLVPSTSDAATIQTLQKAVLDSLGFPEAQAITPNFCIYDGIDAHSLSSYIANNPIPTFNLEFDGLEVIVNNIGDVSVGKVTFGTRAFLRCSMFIDGKWTGARKSDFFPVHNPADGTILQLVPSASVVDVDAAVLAAKNAWPIWSGFSAEKRAELLVAMGNEIAARVQDLTMLESLDNGKPLNEAKLDVDDTAACFRYYAEQILEFEKKNQDQALNVGDDGFHVTVRYEPVGVCGLIIPWNYPLLMAAWKVAPCLAAGCTCVLKPSELTPLSALELAGIAHSVGIPPGVLNVVTGYGPQAGAPLAEHPGVDKVAFTGSVPTGSRIMEVGAKSVKKVTLELGGKSPIIVCKDADISQAVDWITCGIFFNAGQVCSATSRLIVHVDVKDEILRKIKEVAQSIKLGCGQDESTQMGPLVSKGQYERVLGYINSGLEEGATLVCGGAHPSGSLEKGFFVSPTIFANVLPHMKIWREEIFGPVLCVTTFSTEDEAVFLANDTSFGLGAAVLSQNNETCERIAKKFQAGIVWINCSQPTLVQAPWGGYKKSGTGRELGPWGLLNYFEVKQITRWVNTKAKGWNWFTAKM